MELKSRQRNRNFESYCYSNLLSLICVDLKERVCEEGEEVVNLAIVEEERKAHF